MNSTFEDDYKELLAKAITIGSLEPNRTKVDAYTLFGETLKFNCVGDLVPIITGKRIFYKKAWYEYQWIKQGGTTTKYLNEHKINWWNQYADSNGYLGKTYGYQLRNFNGEFDQLQYVVNQIKFGSRRAHISLWNPCDLKEQALPCCYTGLTFRATRKGELLNLSINFRSSDLFLGFPYDALFAYFLLQDVARETEKRIGEIQFVFVDAHVYANHLEQVEEYLSLPTYNLPAYIHGPHLNYKHGPFIKAKLNN